VTRYTIAISALLGLAALAGCTGPRAPQAAAQPLCLSSMDGYRAFDAALAVLGQMDFTIDKADPNTGIIRTNPLPAAQFFEVWRSDNVTLRDQAEANLNSLRRIAWVTITPRAADVCVDCLVRVQRLNVPTQVVTGSATAYRTLSESTVYAQSLRLSPEQQRAMEWMDLGTDAPLAARILARIEGRLKKSDANQQPHG
jgi:hypothetical protein